MRDREKTRDIQDLITCPVSRACILSIRECKSMSRGWVREERGREDNIELTAAIMIAHWSAEIPGLEKAAF